MTNDPNLMISVFERCQYYWTFAGIYWQIVNNEIIDGLVWWKQIFYGIKENYINNSKPVLMCYYIKIN